MKRNLAWVVTCSILVLSLLAASCAPTTTSTQTPTSTSTSNPTSSTTPTSTPTSTATPTSPTAGPEMVTVTLKKLDGTTVQKTVEKPQYGGTLTLMRPSAILSWDEAYTPPWTGSGWHTIHLEELMEGDYFRGASGTDEVSWQLSGWFDVNYMNGALAESWVITQPDTITYKIRQGVHWGLNPVLEASKLVNGRELKGSDIAYNIKRYFFDMKTSGIYGVAGISRPLEVTNPDDWTVVVKAPQGQIWQTFEYINDWIHIYPPEVIQKYGDAQEWTRAVGTGPFVLTDYVAMSSATFIKNTNYWQKDPLFPENKLPYIDTVKLLIIPDSSTQRSALRTGQVDLDNSAIYWEDAASYKKTNPELQFSKMRGGTSYLIGGRMDKPELPFKDINVRRALMMAIDHNEMINTYYGGEAVIFDYPAPDTKEWAKAYTPLDQLGLASDGFDTKTIYQYNIDKAKQLLTQAGYPDGFKTEIVVNSGAAGMVDLLTIVKAYWAKVNVDLTLDVKETGVFNTLLQRKTHNQMLVTGYATTGLPHNMDPERTGNAYNWAMVSDPQIAERYDKMAALQPRTDEWWNVVKDNNLFVIHQVYYSVPPRPFAWYFWQPWLKRYNGELSTGVWDTYYWPKYAWIDQNLKAAK